MKLKDGTKISLLSPWKRTIDMPDKNFQQPAVKSKKSPLPVSKWSQRDQMQRALERSGTSNGKGVGP